MNLPIGQFFIFVLLLFSFPAFAQTFSFRNYTVEDGLANSTVYWAHQDKKGFIWFATETGISRFDGQKFQNYTTEDGLADNTTLGFYEDSKGRIWVYSLSGLLSYFHENRFHRFDLLKKYNVRSIMEANNDDMLFGTFNGEIIKVRKDSSVEVVWRTAPPGYIAFFKDNDKKNWITNSGFYGLFRDEKMTLHNVRALEDTMGVPGMIFPKRGDAFFYTGSEIVLLKDTLQQHVFKNEHDRYGRYNFFLEDKDGTIWATTNKGFYNMGDNIHALTMKNQFLKNKYATRILQDKEGNFWIPTIGDGVFFLPNKNIFNYTKQDGLPHDKVNCITGDGEGTIWMGMNNGMLCSLNGKKINSYDGSIIPAPSKRVLCALASPDGSIWFGKDDGIVVMKRNGKMEKNSRTNVYMLKSLHADKDNNVWAGTASCLLKISGNKIEKIREDGRITAVCPDFNGTVWISEKAELKNYNGKKIINYAEKSELLRQRTYCIRQSSDSTIWVATHGKGLVSVKGDEIKNISAKDGLASDICNFILIDNENNTIWAATNNGLSKIIFSVETQNVASLHGRRNFTIYNITARHGLSSNEINGIYKQGDTLWLATNKGVCFFNEKKIKPNTVAPPVHITRVKIMEQDTAILDNYELPYHKSNIKIEYVGLAYRNRKSMQYKYRMNGIDTAWAYTSFSNVQYPRLPSGDYTFMVSAANEDGYWSEKPATIHFTIQPPYWETWLFRASALLAFIGMVTGIAYWRVSRIRKRESEKTAFNKRIAESELNALKAQMNPHFIFNSLNSIHSYILKNNEEIAGQYLVDFAQLMRMILSNSRKESIPIAGEIEVLNKYLELEKLRFKEKFDYSIAVIPPVDTNYMEIPPMLVQPYIENAILHGINYLENKKGVIGITFGMEKDILTVSVEDNGIGRKKAMELKAKSRKTHQSLGMKITKDRLEILNSMRESKMSVQYTDLENGNGEPLGTRVEIYIPLEN